MCTSLWAIIRSCFRTRFSPPSFITPSCGRRTSENPANLPVCVHVYSIVTTDGLCARSAVPCARFLFRHYGARSRSVCAGCCEVSDCFCVKRTLHRRCNHQVGRSERCAIERLSTRYLAERISREGRAEKRVRTLHATWRSMAGFSCCGLQRQGHKLAVVRRFSGRRRFLYQ